MADLQIAVGVPFLFLEADVPKADETRGYTQADRFLPKGFPWEQVPARLMIYKGHGWL